MKTSVQKKLTGVLILFLVGFTSVFFSDCKGRVEIDDITDSIQNCSPPFVVNFYPHATYGSRDLEFTWNFGDGTESHDKEPVHIYTEYGTYEVTLTIRQKEAMESKSIYLYLIPDSVAPFADWDYASKADSLWAPAYVEFQNYSKHTTHYLWAFGDGETSTDKNPIHIYETQGTYTTLLNAMCNDDTSKYSRQMVIKPAPSDILINEVTIWMPNQHIGYDVWVEIYYAGFHEATSSLAQAVTSFPITFVITDPLYNFNGNYNSDLLVFELWSSNNDGDPERVFDVESRSLQLEYYPNIIGESDNYGRRYEALLEYRN